MIRRAQKRDKVHLPAGVHDELLGELGGGAPVTAHDLPEIAQGGPRLGTDFLAPVGAVLLEEGFCIHGSTIFASREDCKRAPRLAFIRTARFNAPMDIKAIRRKNLEMLLSDAHTFDAIAKKVGIDPNYLSQINTGYRGMGDRTARRIEDAYGQMLGWMDTLHLSVSEQNFEPVTRTLLKVPLISWVSAGHPKDVADPYQPGAAESWEEIEGPVSNLAFALRVRGDSMIAPDGTGFPDGSIIVVEPAREAKNKDFVIARFQNRDEATFKQYIIDGPNILLKALNPAYPTIVVNSDARISGVVTEAVMRKRF